ncbi:FtsK/SpoIIIE domain-containing protein [Nocardioides pantholopis]|uniref:FtsK/SpoIIIE domain-containing protein n=1 Tax=Nocardioides pantholopis TaxID=2483798 RepID=UPI000F0912D3|nr:FtsK/SpoIIIE domain-containing protein [Nocardioides pantholopis]
MRITVTLETPSASADVLVDCDDATPAAALDATLCGQVGMAAGSMVVAPRSTDSRPAPTTGTIADLGLRDGMRVGFGSHQPAVPLPSDRGVQLHVVGGPDSGAVFALPLGVHEVGRSGPVSWRDHSLSRRHCRVVVSPESATVTDLGSSNGTRVDGEDCEPHEPRPWGFGQVLEIGDSLVELRPARPSDATVETGDPGWLGFLRPPRIVPFHASPSVEVPSAPKSRQRRKIPLIAMLVPMVFGISMALILKTPTFLLFALMSPVMLGANFISDRRGEARDHREAVAQYEKDLAEAQRRLEEGVRSEQARLRAEQPDAADTFLTCVLPGRRLWERRRHDPDALLVRLGTSDLPSTVTVTGEKSGADHELHAVPVGFGLGQAHVVGIAGPHDAVDGALRWTVAQLAAYHAPRDLTMSFLTTRGGQEWSWLRWLPHLRPEEADSCLAMVGNDTETLTAQVAALTALVKARKEIAGDNRAVTADSFPAHVAVLHGYRAMRGVLGLGQVLEDGPSVGVYAICTDDSEKSLPERCTATFVLDPANPSYAALRRSGQAPLPRVLAEGVSAGWADRVARELSPLRDVGAQQQGESLPDSARLLDVTGMEPPTADAVRARWMMEPRSTTMTLGVGLDGPFSLDLRSDGPHGLIAGMTGSGKTELLQTIIASLAIANRPEWLNFVLIDYKGDSAFKDCVNLPHTVGKVNDLDPYLVERALASLEAEMDVRKNFLAEAGTKDIEDYQDLYSREPHRPPLPRLVLVIDEFAELAKELPDFMTGLVSIAQLGRSLGVHLLLATQRPSGVVSPAIRANTNLRIALRVADSADSTDVLQTADAARIPKSAPGRAYARLGAGALLAFQSGRVGGRRPGAVAVDLPAPFVAQVGWRALGYASPRPPRVKQEEVVDTDLAALVRAVADASTQEGVPAQRQPWLPPLPTRVLWDEWVTDSPRRGEVPALPFARRDLPALQRQVVADLDLDRDGHLFLVGSARSGRSQALRTIAGSIARLADPSDVHVYGLDCGSGALNALTALPHCGAVVGRAETERATRLLTKLANEVDDRQRRLAEQGYADIREQRAADADPLPHVVVMIDRWEGFVTTLGEIDPLTDVVLKLLREGASAGVHLVITGDRSLVSSSRMSTTTENKIALKMADKGDYSLVGVNPKQVPDRVPPGRGYVAADGTEMQVMLLAADESGQAQAAALQALGQEARSRVDATTRKPFRVDVLPTRMELEQALALRPERAADPFVLVGVGGDELTAYAPDLGRSSSFIVAGPGRSGRSTVLVAAARAAIATGACVVGLAPRPSPVRDLDGTAGVLGVFTDPATPAATIEELVAGAGRPVVLVIDDGEGLRDAAASEFFARVVKGQVEGCFLLLGGNADGVAAGLSGWQVEAKKARQGLLLSPQGISDGDLVGVRIPRNALGRTVQPGRGWLHFGDGVLTQVATVLA